jgi:hypothetical protein
VSDRSAAQALAEGLDVDVEAAAPESDLIVLRRPDGIPVTVTPAGSGAFNALSTGLQALLN